MTKIQKAFWFTYKKKYKPILEALKANKSVDHRDHQLNKLWNMSLYCGYCSQTIQMCHLCPLCKSPNTKKVSPCYYQTDYNAIYEILCKYVSYTNKKNNIYRTDAIKLLTKLIRKRAKQAGVEVKL